MIRRIDRNTGRQITIVVVALLVLGVGHLSRIKHIDYVSNLGNGDTIQVDRESSTGYENGRRKLIVPDRNVQTYQWIMQGQQMLNDGTWNLERVEYDNAPDGRPVLTPSSYRWLLASLAWLISLFAGIPLGVSVERAALYLDPALQFLTIASASLLMRRLSWRSSALFAAGVIALFPLGASFYPGQADDSTVAIIFNLFAVLPLLVAIAESWNRGEAAVSSRLVAIAGVSGGFSLWVSASGGGAVLLAIAGAGALLGISRRLQNKWNKFLGDDQPAINWRVWARSGAITVVAVWVLENGSSVFEVSSWGINFVNPIYAVIWLCLGELLGGLDSEVALTGKRKVIQISTLALLSATGIVYLTTANLDWAVNQIGLDLSRASLAGDSGSSINFLAEGGSIFLVVFALSLPSLAVVLAVAYLVGLCRTRSGQLNFLLGVFPMLVTLTLAIFSMGWWAHFQALALGWAAVSVSSHKAHVWYRVASAGTLVFALVVGSALVFKDLSAVSEDGVSEGELVSLVERDLANWVSLRQDPERPVVLSSPNTAASLAFYASLKVLSTPYPENLDGFAAAVRLSAAATADEAQAIADGRSIDFIIDPSWDSYLEEYAEIGSNEIEQSFALLLKQWLPPLWLRPMSYQIPSVDGFEGERIVLFRTIENQRQEDALARLTEYFIDSKLAENAMKVHAALAMNFPDKLVTHLTRAELALALGDKRKLGEALTGLHRAIDRGEADYLDWDFRVNIALVLLGSNEVKEAKRQLKICVEEASKERIRQLSEGSLKSFKHILDALKWKLPTEDLDRYLTELAR